VARHRRLPRTLRPQRARRAAVAGAAARGHACDRIFARQSGDPLAELPTIHGLLVGTRLRALPLWLLGSDADEQRATRAAVARGARGSPIEYRLGLAALADRDFEGAALRFGRVLALGHPARPALHLRIYALCMAGRLDEAAALADRLATSPTRDERDDAALRFLAETFALPPRAIGPNGP
jgi:hypothetical protein